MHLAKCAVIYLLEVSSLALRYLVLTLKCFWLS